MKVWQVGKKDFQPLPKRLCLLYFRSVDINGTVVIELTSSARDIILEGSTINRVSMLGSIRCTSWVGSSRKEGEPIVKCRIGDVDEERNDMSLVGRWGQTLRS